MLNSWYSLIKNFLVSIARLIKKPAVLYSFIFSFALLLLLPVGGAYWYQSSGHNQKPEVIVIKPGWSLGKIMLELEKQKLITNPKILTAICLLLGESKNLQAGEYRFKPYISPAEIIEILKSGSVIQHKFTIPEGMSTYQVMKKLEESELFTGQLPPSLKEGSLLPETYSFTRNTSLEKMLEIMQQAMQGKLHKIWHQGASQNILIKSPEELIILASIVEKETGIPQERPLIAAVFLNRLRLGIPLQSDPTVVFALTENGKYSLGRALTKEDMKIDSPYNTYLHAGLPPTPIANPGVDSMHAVMNPADVDYLYFVADGSGGHIFAENLKEHQRNHAKWRIIREKKRKEEESHSQ